MSKVNAWWHGLKEWQRVAIAAAAIPLLPVVAILFIPTFFIGLSYCTARDVLDDLLGGGK